MNKHKPQTGPLQPKVTASTLHDLAKDTVQTKSAIRSQSLQLPSCQDCNDTTAKGFTQATLHHTNSPSHADVLP